MSEGLTVDTAHLLSKHDGRCTIVRTSNTRHGEAVPHTLEISGTAGLLEFLLVDNVRVVVISGGNDGVRSQARHGTVSLCILAVLHEPTRRLRAEPDTETENERWDECRTELKTPGDGAGSHDDAVRRETQKDTCLVLASSPYCEEGY